MYFRSLLMLIRQIFRHSFLIAISLAAIFAFIFADINSWLPIIEDHLGAEFSMADEVLFSLRGKEVLFAALPILVILSNIIIQSDEAPTTVLLIGSRRRIWSVTVFKYLLLSLILSAAVMLLNIPIIRFFGITQSCGWGSESGVYFAAFGVTAQGYSLFKICLISYIYLALTTAMYCVMSELLRWIINSGIIAIALTSAEILLETLGSPLIMRRSNLYLNSFAEGRSRLPIYLVPAALTAAMYIAGLLAAGRKEFLNVQKKK